MSAVADLLLLLLLLVLRVVFNREPRLVVFPTGPQLRRPRGSVPCRTSTASCARSQPAHNHKHTHKHTATSTHPQTHNHKHTTTNTAANTITNTRSQTQLQDTTTTHMQNTQPQRLYIFEPFNYNGWGKRQDEQKREQHQTIVGRDAELQAQQRMDCVYRCLGCESLVTKGGQGQKLMKACTTEPDAVIIKTVAIAAMFSASSLLHLPSKTLKRTKLVLMPQDPRSMHDRWH